MRQQNYSNKKSQAYYANQWAEAGVYRCIDPCLPEHETVTLEKDGILPDTSYGEIARFRRIKSVGPKYCSKKSSKERDKSTKRGKIEEEASDGSMS